MLFKMELFKTVFILTIMEYSQSIQINPNANITEFIDAKCINCLNNTTNITATGCKIKSGLKISFAHDNQINFIKPNTNCTNIEKKEEFFVINNTNYCNEYVIKYNNKEVKITGQSLNEIEEECPDEETIPLFYCPMEHFTIKSEFDTDEKFIKLKMTWNTSVLENEDIEITITPNDCHDSYHSQVHARYSLFDKAIVLPNHFPDKEVQPNCNYNIVIDSEEMNDVRTHCRFNFTVPECVESLCDCRTHKAKAKIVNIEHLVDNSYRIEWDPGSNIIKGKKQSIIATDFSYYELNAFDHISTTSDKNDMNKYITETTMLLKKESDYVIIGRFTNNFLCTSITEFNYKPVERSYETIILILVLICLLVCFILIKCKLFFKYKTKIMKLFVQNTTILPDSELKPLQHVQIAMNDNRQYTPLEIIQGLCDEYEFPRNKITIKEEIGRGAFGKVYSAKALGIADFQGDKMVAVKTLEDGPNVTQEAIVDFVHEIEIFKKIGVHKNIVRLLGCCMLEQPYWMIMEFIPCGDLKNYLLELRAEWLKNRSKTKQIFFSDDGAYLQLTPSPTTPNSPLSITSSNLPRTPETASTFLEDQLTPQYYMESLDCVLDPKELQNFAFQIAQGMSHLEKISITHRDLAARNILIDEYKTLKISDFGFSRTGTYVNTKVKRLPLRWTALESLLEQKYDSKSDVWSFGIVLWEIGTLGAFPYEKVHDSLLVHFLQMGKRLERPEICTDELFSVMTQCWACDPNQRPTFEQLVELLNVNRKRVYVDFDKLNPTYVFPPSEI